ncbi:hypothetical protein NHX12_022774, partial [Muraenolepis orangiensis]
TASQLDPACLSGQAMVRQDPLAPSRPSSVTGTWKSKTNSVGAACAASICLD